MDGDIDTPAVSDKPGINWYCGDVIDINSVLDEYYTGKDRV